MNLAVMDAIMLAMSMVDFQMFEHGYIMMGPVLFISFKADVGVMNFMFMPQQFL